MPVSKSKKEKPPSNIVPDGLVFSETLKDGTVVFTDPNKDLHRTRCAGLDVHKDSIMAAICITDPLSMTPTYSVKKFGTTNSEFLNLAEFLQKYGVSDVCMESTGKYWVPVYDGLKEQKLNPVLTHPKYVKQIPGKKTDFKDAVNIANMFRSGRVTPSFVPPDDIRELREIIRYMLKLTYVQTSEKNRMQNCMTISRLRIDSVFSDPFGKTGTAILEYLLKTDPADVTDEDILARVDRRIEATSEEILDSIHGFSLSDKIRAKMIIMFDHMQSVDYALHEIDKELLTPYREQYKETLERIETVPGISDRAALFILSEIGNDMSVWSEYSGPN